MVKSTAKSKSIKVKKPKVPKDFPLFPHATGRWAKKIRGQMCYFGRWENPVGAREEYRKQRDALFLGRRQRDVKADLNAGVTGVSPGELTVKRLTDAYLEHKQKRVPRELSPKSLAKYRVVVDILVGSLGGHRAVADLRQEEFAKLRDTMAERWGLLRLRDSMVIIKGVFAYGWKKEDLKMKAPIRWGPDFELPSQESIESEYEENAEERYFHADEALRIIEAAGQPLKAMFLLGINCGFGPTDCGTLKQTRLDLAGGWVNHPRPKTKVKRRCALWPETVAALREWLSMRPEPKEPEANLVFVTKKGASWHKSDAGVNPISSEFRKLLDKLGINGHRNFYAARHTVGTIGGGAKDPDALRAVMGHKNKTMGKFYSHAIDDDRLKAVADHVRSWLFGKPAKKSRR